MLLTILVSSIFAVIIAALVAAALVMRRRRHALSAKREAAQLQRRADHLFKIALAAQVHTRDNTIALTLLDEAVRVLDYSAQLDPAAEPTAKLLRECRELKANIDAEAQPADDKMPNPFIDFPETELIEAQMHLTEALRLLIGLEKRGQIDYDALTRMTVSLKQAQRATDLHLQLLRASSALDGDRNTPKRDEAMPAAEYLAVAESNRAHPPH